MKADRARTLRMRRVRWLFGILPVTEDYRLVKAIKSCKKGQLVTQEDVVIVNDETKAV